MSDPAQPRLTRSGALTTFGRLAAAAGCHARRYAYVALSSETLRIADLWERMKIVVEPTGALAAAALLEGGLDARGRRVGVIVSGGNVDLNNLAARGVFAAR